MADSLEEMIEYDLLRRGINDERLLAAIRRVDRGKFVTELEKPKAYADHPLHLTHGQTISQPYIVALMTDCLRLTGTEKVLEVGTGSGWQTALLAELAREVWTIERLEPLATMAEDRLTEMGYKNIRYFLQDGSLGYPSGAPFDRIIASAGCPKVPPSWEAQLAEGGRLVAPVGSPEDQYLCIGVKQNGRLVQETGISCRFVLMLGKEGFDERFSRPDSR
jgi:protein-L-isoaspartate(D-aspartate) O-methyltransferase